MNRSKLNLALVVVLIICAWSCKTADKKSAMIPGDAGVVLHINGSSLNSKLSWDEIKQTDWFKELYSGASDSISKQLMEDPGNSGIDTKQDMVFFLEKRGKGGYFAFQGYIKDTAVFAAFNNKISKNAARITEGGYNSQVLANKAVVTWNQNRFIYMGDAPIGNASSYMSQGNQDTPSGFTTDSLRQFSMDLFELPSDKSLGDNDKFTDLIKENGDIHLWLNAGSLYGDLGNGMLSMMKINTLLQGNVSASTINFDNGKISLKSKQYYNSELTNLIKKYPPKKIDASLVNRIPSNNVAAAFVFNYPPEGLKEFLKLIGVDGMVNGFLGKAGYSMDEFIKANKGDFLLSFSDFSVDNKNITIPNPNGEPYVYRNPKPKVKFLFATSVNDKAAFEKLIGIVKDHVPFNESNKLNITYKLNNDWFTVGNSPEYVNSFASGTTNKQPFADKISGHPYGGFIDIQKLLQGSRSVATESNDSTVLNASLKMWQDVTFHGGDLNNDAMTTEVEINLIDKNTNSLKQLNQYFNMVAKLKKNKSAHAGWPSGDSTVPDIDK